MTVREFKEYIESKAHISKAVFWTENQEGYSVANPCKIRMASPIFLFTIIQTWYVCMIGQTPLLLTG